MSIDMIYKSRYNTAASINKYWIAVNPTTNKSNVENKTLTPIQYLTGINKKNIVVFVTCYKSQTAQATKVCIIEVI